MTDLEKFNSVWKFTGQRAKQTQDTYEQILFSLWKNHRDWKDEDEDDGFQISCKEDRTIYRVRELAEEAGLLVMVKNYSVGNHTRTYHKNNVLFDLIFRDKDNKYGNWLIKVNKKIDKDIIFDIYNNELNNLNIPYVDTSLKNKISNRILKKLNYDIEKLYQISRPMLIYYHSLLLKLNENVIDESLKFKYKEQFNPDDFKLKSFLYFDQKGLPKGRPWSYFCSTLNDNKIHKRVDNSFEKRSVYLDKIGLGDYYEVYDIKSEIPRINWLFHTGEWKPDNYDFYTEIIKDTGMIKYIDWEIQRGKADSEYYYESMKQLFMRINFGKGSEEQSYNGYDNDRKKRILEKTNAKCWIEAQKLNYKERRKETNNFKCVKCFYSDNCPEIRNCSGFDKFEELRDKQLGKEELDFEIWKILCESTENICGPSIGPLVFWYAFFIETEVKIELMKRGKIVYNVYDGFYFNNDIKDEIIDIIKIKSKYVYDNYMKPIKLNK